jgi:hypothetical protein
MKKLDLFRLMVLRQAIRVEPPTDLVLKITNRCNFTCWACPRDTLTESEKQAEMLYDQACNWVTQYSDILPKKRKGNVAVTGLGEPTLWPHLYDLLEVIAASGNLTWELSTNGWLWKPHNLVEGIISRGWVHFSVDRMHERGHPFVEEDSDWKHYSNHLTNVVEESVALGYKVTVRVHGDPATDPDLYQISGVKIKRAPLLEFKPGKRWLVCPKMWREMVIEPDGATSMCCVMNKAIDHTRLIGMWSEGWANDQRYLILSDQEKLCRTCPRYRRSPVTWVRKAIYQRKIKPI